MLILVNTSLSTPPRPTIAPYRHVKPLDRQTYHQHHRRAYSANGERIREFSESIKKGKEIADAEIASSLFHRAKGYSHPEDKIFNNQGVELVVPTIKHYPPDTTAAIFWLKNRQKDNWRDKQEVDTNVNMNINNLTDDELDAKIQALMNGNSW